MPSREEGYGLVACEALSIGVPVLISSSSGLAEVVREMADTTKMSVTECVVDHTDDANEIAKRYATAAIEYLADEGAAADYSNKLLERLLQKCSWETAGKHLLSELELLTNSRDKSVSTPTVASNATVTASNSNVSDVLERNKGLLRQPGVLSISVRQAIMVFVKRGEADGIPEKIEDIDVIVREVDDVRFSSAASVESGARVLINGVVKSRVGAIVLNTDGIYFGTTAAHAIPQTTEETSVVIQTSGGQIESTLELVDRDADLALIKLPEDHAARTLVSATQPNLNQRVAFVLPDRRIEGVVSGVSVTAQVSAGTETFLFEDMFAVQILESRVEPGDSGALVVDADTNAPIGLFVASVVSTEANQTIFVKSIANTLDRFGLQALDRRAR